jgi:heme exporter protein A
MSLTARQLGLTRGERSLFQDVELALQAGDALLVTGENGSGKTSLLRILAGLSLPVSGEVCWNGEDIRRLREQYSAQMVYLGHAGGVKEDLLAWENLVLAVRLAGQKITQQQACDVLEQLGLGGCVDLPVRALSQGQRKRVALARLHLDMPQTLWLLDEAFTALDVASVAALLQRIDRHLGHGGMVVYTTHQAVNLQAGRSLTLDLNQVQNQPQVMA